MTPLAQRAKAARHNLLWLRYNARVAAHKVVRWLATPVRVTRGWLLVWLAVWDLSSIPVTTRALNSAAEVAAPIVEWALAGWLAFGLLMAVAGVIAVRRDRRRHR